MKFRYILILLASVFFLTTETLAETTSKPSPEVAQTGILIMNIYELDMTTNSFFADFYLWVRYNGEIDPLKNLEFVNQIEQWSFTKTLIYETPLRLKDGTNYDCIRFQGKFHHNFTLDNYPIDHQTIQIQIENSVHTVNELIYKADKANSKLEKGVIIPGWIIDEFAKKENNHIYASNFGLPETVNNDSYSNLCFSIKMHRPIEYFLWKLLLPLMIVFVSSLGATMIYPSYIDARIYAPVGALLTTVFLQQSYTSLLPDISYLILTDKIYVVVYTAILAGIFHAIYTANIIKGGDENSFAKAQKLDRRYLVSIVIFLIAATCFLIYA